MIMKYAVLVLVLCACVENTPCDGNEPAAESYLDWSEQFESELRAVDARWLEVVGPGSGVHVRQTTVWRWSAPATYAECQREACHRCSVDGSCLLIVPDAEALDHDSARSAETVKRTFAEALVEFNGRADVTPSQLY